MRLPYPIERGVPAVEGAKPCSCAAPPADGRRGAVSGAKAKRGRFLASSMSSRSAVQGADQCDQAADHSAGHAVLRVDAARRGLMLFTEQSAFETAGLLSGQDSDRQWLPDASPLSKVPLRLLGYCQAKIQTGSGSQMHRHCSAAMCHALVRVHTSALALMAVSSQHDH